MQNSLLPFHDTTDASALSSGVAARSAALAAAGYNDLSALADDLTKAQITERPFDLSVLAGHEPHYYRTHQRYQMDFREVLGEMERRHCEMPYAASKYERAMSCGDQLVYGIGGASDRARVALAFRCGLPLCPCCEASRSHKRLMDLSDALAYLQAQRAAAGQAPLVTLMLTETLPNCRGEQLSAYMDLLFAAHNRLMHYKAVSSVVLGTARSFEITHRREDDYHPHLHTLLLVDASYFNNKSAARGYLPQAEWARLHYKAVRASCKACGIDWADIQQPDGQTFAVHIERAYKRGAAPDALLCDAAGSAAREAAKYVCKPDEILRYNADKSINMDWSCEAVDTIGRAIKGRRRYTSSGLWREALAACGLEADMAPDDDIGSAVSVPRSERVPDASGTAYMVIDTRFDSRADVRDYLVNRIFSTSSPDDDGPLLGSPLHIRAVSNLIKRDKRERVRRRAADGPLHLELVDGHWAYTGLEKSLPPDHGVRPLPDDIPTPFDDVPASDSPSADAPSFAPDAGEQLHFD